MSHYVILLRGVNVGGKSKVSMTALRSCLEALGYTHVSTYINSGNILLESKKAPSAIKTEVESAIRQSFHLAENPIQVLVLSHEQLSAVVHQRPKGFGDQPDTYHSDVIFLIGIHVEEAIKVFRPRGGIDTVWAGEGVIYSQRLSAQRTKSRLNTIIATPEYKKMTIRNWNTTTKLLTMLDERSLYHQPIK